MKLSLRLNKVATLCTETNNQRDEHFFCPYVNYIFPIRNCFPSPLGFLLPSGHVLREGLRPKGRRRTRTRQEFMH